MSSKTKKAKAMKKGWYRKAKIKFLNERVYSYELVKRGMFGSDRVEERREGKLRCVWYGCRQADWQYDICKVAGFAERFLWGQNLVMTQPKEFYLDYKLKKNFKY